MRKVISIVLALALVLSMSAVAFAASGSSSGGGGGSSTGTTTQTLSDGTKVETTNKADGTKEVVSTAKDGSETVETTLSASAANKATDAAPYTTPTVTAASEDSDAATVKVTVPSGVSGGSATVEFAVKNPSAGVVVKEKQADGSYKTVKLAAVGDKGPVVEVKSGKSEFIVVDNSLEFNDLEPWMAEGALFASSRELMVGIYPGVFRPQEEIDAQTVATVLGRLDDKVTLEESTGKTWETAGENYANANGYKATGAMPRTEMFGQLYKFAGNPAVTEAQKNAVKAAFSDVADLSDADLTAVAWAYANKLTKGMPGGKFGGDTSANRAMFSVLLERYVDYLVK